MNGALTNLAGTEGVRGVIVFDADGTCVANDLPAPYEPMLLAETAKRVAEVCDVFASLDDGAVNSFSVVGEEGGIVLRYVAPHTLIALTTPTVNMNVLNVAMNVVALNLGRKTSGTQPLTSSRSAIIDPIASQASHASQTLSQSGDIPEQQIPPDALERAVVLQLLDVYRNFLGPAAKLVFKQQLAAFGVTSRTLRAGQYGDFVIRLAQKIPSPERQREFVLAAQKLRDRGVL
jgi:predicted regulator of Ras-like GTPase activity (Roadblock/LC7/MglB family)